MSAAISILIFLTFFSSLSDVIAAPFSEPMGLFEGLLPFHLIVSGVIGTETIAAVFGHAACGLANIQPRGIASFSCEGHYFTSFVLCTKYIITQKLQLVHTFLKLFYLFQNHLGLLGTRFYITHILTAFWVS